MDIAVVAGEASGDRHAAELVKALRADEVLQAALKPGEDLNFWGIGGVALLNAGVRLIGDSREWGAIGVIEALGKVPRVLPARLAIGRQLRKTPPDAIILVDFGFFNLGVAQWVKSRLSCPVLYFMPPGSWRRDPPDLSRGKGGAAARLVRCADAIVTPFPWSERNLKSMGANVAFFGHPLLDLVKTTATQKEMDDRFGLDPQRTVIALLPGSRSHEVEHVLPAMFGAAGNIAARVPGAQFLVALAPNMSRAVAARILEREQRLGGSANLLHLMQAASGALVRAATAAISLPPVKQGPVLATNEGVMVDSSEVERVGKARARAIRPAQTTSAPVAVVEGMTYDTIARADLVIVTSGTATLETAILNRPMIIVYRGSKIMELEWAVRKKSSGVRYIGLPNILADRKICPELIQEEATPRAISDIAIEMLVQPDALMRMKQELRRTVVEQLGQPGGIQRAARYFAEEILKGGRRN